MVQPATVERVVVVVTEPDDITVKVTEPGSGPVDQLADTPPRSMLPPVPLGIGDVVLGSVTPGT
ncbi:MAG TPA: hypothetical protein DCY55_01730 [Gammaproteobacteria bacterium]|nr:hypothetical protein [Gammaproteobacteria bacterium]